MRARVGSAGKSRTSKKRGSKKRVPADTHGARRHDDWITRALRRHGFIGVSLYGGKSDKTCLAFVEYYPEQNKVFLSELHDKIKGEGDLSADLILHEELSRLSPKADSLAMNVPLTFPKCVRCRVRCPGYEACQEPEMLWMWDHYRKRAANKRDHKLFTPYTERCVEQYIANDLEENFQIQHALGANQAPLTSRAHFILRRLKIESIEIFPRLSLWRIGRSLNIQKSYLRHHRHQVGGSDARKAILKQLVDRQIAFLYEQDVRLMVDNASAFDAFICALTGVLKHKGQCEKPPRDFPPGEGWIEIPKESIVW